MTQPPSELTEEEETLLDELVEREEASVEQVTAAADAVETARDERAAEPYPPATINPIVTGVTLEPEPEEDDEFALPSANAAAVNTPGATDEDVEKALRDPYEGSIPSMVITAELQKALLRSRLVIGHTFESIDVSGPAGNMLKFLQDERPEVYADIVVRVAMAHFICWQKGMGL